MAAQKGLSLTMEVDPAVPLTLNSDRARLQQILNNLLTNALKFTEKGQVQLTASLLPADQDGRQMLQLQVRDSGIGIAKDQQERIFQAFQQIDGSISRHYGGTGLGLAITRQLVEVLGGPAASPTATARARTGVADRRGRCRFRLGGGRGRAEPWLYQPDLQHRRAGSGGAAP
jgi:signal transduction histidine kinase